MTGQKISLVYFYVISAASLALIVIGIFNIVNFLINVTQYGEYPLRYQGATCERYPYKFIDGPTPAIAPSPATPSAKELDEQKKICEEQQAMERKQHELDDLRNSITFSAVGLILFLIHFSLAGKISKESK